MTLSRFVKTYNNIPLAERDMPCCVIDGESVSWKLAYSYIKENSDMGKRVQAQLEILNLI